MVQGGTATADDALDELVDLFLGLIDAWAGLIDIAAGTSRPRPEPRRPFLELD